MLPNQRRDKILELIKEDGQAKVMDLSHIFNVTEVTIRQDLERLELEGFIVREHGGAYLKNIDMNIRNLNLLNQDNIAQKALIAKKAVEFIYNGDTIILDSGSTITEIAKLIKGYKDLTVITNALNIALILGTQAGVNVIVTGGEFKTPTLSLTGQKTADFFQNLHVDKIFFSAAGISTKSELSYRGISDVGVKKAMIDSASEVYLVADSTKIGKISLVTLDVNAPIKYLITDFAIKPEDKAWLDTYIPNIVIAE